MVLPLSISCGDSCGAGAAGGVVSSGITRLLGLRGPTSVSGLPPIIQNAAARVNRNSNSEEPVPAAGSLVGLPALQPAHPCALDLAGGALYSGALKRVTLHARFF